MKIYQIIQGIDNVSAGPSYSVGAMAHFLNAHGDEVEIAALGPRPAHWPFNATLRIFDGGCERLGLASVKTVRWVRSVSREPSILHGHSVWRAANLFPLALHKHTHAKIVWSPRGTFSEWSWRYRSAFKRPFWHLLQRSALSRVSCFHATSMEEYEDVRRRGFSGPVAVIANGVDIPPPAGATTRRKKIVFLGRLHPVKGIDLLLAAWRALAARFPDWELIVAGPLDTSYAKDIREHVRLTSLPRVGFPGEVGGAQKTTLLAEAALVVLPSYSENFGMVVAEALAHGTAVITTTATPWRDIPARRCGWYVDAEHDALLRALTDAMSLPDEALRQMGARGREWMVSDYGWPRLAQRMHDVYAWLLHGGARPACVITE